MNKSKEPAIFFRSTALPKEIQHQPGVACFQSNTGATIFIYQETEHNPFVISVVKKGVQPSMKEVKASTKEFAPADAVMAIMIAPQQTLGMGENETYFNVRQIGKIDIPTMERPVAPNEVEPISYKEEAKVIQMTPNIEEANEEIKTIINETEPTVNGAE